MRGFYPLPGSETSSPHFQCGVDKWLTSKKRRRKGNHSNFTVEKPEKTTLAKERWLAALVVTCVAQYMPWKCQGQSWKNKDRLRHCQRPKETQEAGSEWKNWWNAAKAWRLVIAIQQCWCVSFDKFTIVTQDVNIRGNWMGHMGLYVLRLQFSCTSKILPNKSVY